MQRITLADLPDTSVHEVVIRAISATLYQVEIRTCETSTAALLCDAHHTPITFPHLEAIRDCLVDYTVQQYYLLHESPFGEMIGLASAPNTLKTRLAW